MAASRAFRWCGEAAAATLVNKGGLLGVRVDPLTDSTDIVKQARTQRAAELIQQVGLEESHPDFRRVYPALADKIVSSLEG